MTAPSTQVTTLLTQFNLTTASEELVPRLTQAETFETLDTGRLPGPVVQQLKTLATGAFLETATNVLAFGLPGVGKSHALWGLGEQWNRKYGRRLDLGPPE